MFLFLNAVLMRTFTTKVSSTWKTVIIYYYLICIKRKKLSSTCGRVSAAGCGCHKFSIVISLSQNCSIVSLKILFSAAVMYGFLFTGSNGDSEISWLHMLCCNEIQKRKFLSRNNFASTLPLQILASTDMFWKDKNFALTEIHTFRLSFTALLFTSDLTDLTNFLRSIACVGFWTLVSCSILYSALHYLFLWGGEGGGNLMLLNPEHFSQFLAFLVDYKAGWYCNSSSLRPGALEIRFYRRFVLIQKP